jgi:hypothetical protein
MTKGFNLNQVNDLENAAAENATLLERARITKLAQQWISEYRGHDSEECDCRVKAEALENFINHPEFTLDNSEGMAYTELNSDAFKVTQVEWKTLNKMDEDE